LGSSFFALSSEYRKTQLDEFYYLSKLVGVSWSEFQTMPIYFRKYLLDKWVDENKPQ